MTEQILNVTSISCFSFLELLKKYLTETVRRTHPLPYGKINETRVFLIHSLLKCKFKNIIN